MRTVGFAALLLTAVACKPNASPWVVVPATGETAGTTVHIVGVVQYSGVEGGVYSIRADDGTNYDPTNLPLEFKKDGLAVEAEGRKRNDMMGVHQVGPIVQLTRIRSR